MLSAAQDDVARARADVASCQQLPWVEPAAVAYEDQVQAAATDLARCARALAAADGLVSAAAYGGPTWCTSDGGPAPALRGPVTPLARSAVGGTRVRVGAHGVTSVDPAVLQLAAGVLGGTSQRLDHVQQALSVLLVALPEPVLVDPAQRAPIEHVLTAAWAPLHVAQHLRELASRLRGAAAAHADGEGAVARVVRGAAALWGDVVGRAPAPVLAAEGVALGGVLGLAGLLVVGRTADAIGVRNTEALLQVGGSAAGKLAVRSGTVEVAATALSGVARAQSGALTPSLHPVPGGAAALSGLLAGPAGRAVVTPVPAPVQQAAPHGVGDVMELVARTYGADAPTGTPGTDVATVTVQRLDRPDGTRAWVVAVPGTQTMAMSGAVPTDMGTNLRLEAGLADTMTAGVLGAMHQAGVGAGEPVTLVGHSQGGMVAMSAAAAAAGSFTVGAVVTAGSPDVPAPLPSGVPVVRMEHVEDGTARVDGAPTALTSQVTTVTRELSEDGHGTPDWGTAHRVGTYVETARRVDRAAADAPGTIPGVDALDRVLGGPGTRATTSQYVIRRDVG